MKKEEAKRLCGTCSLFSDEALKL